MKIMLLTDMPPCNNYTAGIVLNIMCGFLLEEGHDVCCFSVQAEGLNPAPEIPEDKKVRMNFSTLPKPRENWGHATPSTISSFVGNNMMAILKLPQISKKIARFAKENDVELIWCVAQGQSMTRLIRPISKLTGVPYVVQIWDPLGWWLRGYRFDNLTSHFVMKEFGRVLRDSKCCIAASWAMADEYKKKYNCPNSIPVILGFDPSRVEPVTSKDKDSFVIAFSGQMYASDEMYSLIAALNQLNWQYNGNNISLKLYGKDFPPNIASDNPMITMCGWVPYESLLSELAGADLLYCPYWFSEIFEEESRLSFPSKLTVYLKTGVPVLLHGPSYSSPRIFLENNSAGYICDSLDVNVIAETLEKIITDTDRNEVGEAGYQAFVNNLTLDKMRENFFQVLQI